MEVIQNGRVKVNGKTVTEPSLQVSAEHDKVEVDGRPVEEKSHAYIMLNKPSGYVTTKEDRFAEKTVMDLLPEKFRHLQPVGRLDKDTEGLLLLTNDGDTAYRLTHPKFNVDKKYLVRVTGRLTLQEKHRLEKGVMIEDQKTSPAKIRDIKYTGDRTDFLISIHEGRKRQIRLMLKAVGHEVIGLKRVVQGPLALGDLPVGKWRMLDSPEVEQLKHVDKGTQEHRSTRHK
jgi:23S rRNA pseudouridine2605 synthase/16S rRNA pseudouridine516 synthase